MGLFDNQDPDKQNALNMGMLTAGLGMLQHNTGQSQFGPAFGQGALEGVQAYQQALTTPIERSLLSAKAQQTLAEAQQAQMSTAHMKLLYDFWAKQAARA